jgi:hypothetical protein
MIKLTLKRIFNSKNNISRPNKDKIFLKVSDALINNLYESEILSIYNISGD